MPFENIMFAAICWACSLIFGLISLWSFKRRGPMHFWSGSTIKPAEISDIRAYNRANGIMWAVYTACMAAAGVLGLFSMKAGVIAAVAVCIPGFAVLIIVYHRIYKKYRRTSNRS